VATKPTKVTIRMYNVGFGDCFLLTFHYDEPLKDQHILIDFGSVGGNANLSNIAKDIKKACGGKLYAIFATHRHKDHIAGFSDAGGKESPGAIIASCKPGIVIQPWTENPNAAANATSASILCRQSNETIRRAKAAVGSIDAACRAGMKLAMRDAIASKQQLCAHSFLVLSADIEWHAAEKPSCLFLRWVCACLEYPFPLPDWRRRVTIDESYSL
jgi:ribonuclease BN (tRNA processing enzyme)